jgi:hypothetical protein
MIDAPGMKESHDILATLHETKTIEANVNECPFVKVLV